ncbi:Polyketide cyclase / dehydrase and lipid transport [Terriglobus roseus DSM 18391]|uniref:Polyketide cyclase / dehydrase and lipid transport n=1 Tax=Terriglobus roseus (strain DSM 18391 / NRRL B-41598 / KBS 63) TaxID=926566 RepID=I3ZEV1_TERRK|nr:SRPBCC family protein [Terriglobus roseus]AFL87769.1 Polyketide cyclase / dehydrase and lipid transport [Terriglobus roseus DSM 18391]
MRRLLAIVLVVIVLIVAAWGIGYMQPLDHTASYTAIVPASQSAVWERIADVQDQPTWRKGLSVSPARSVNGRPCWQETAGKLPIMMCVEVSTAPRLREVGLSSPGNFRGTWIYQLDAVSPTQTRLQMTETVIIQHPSWRFFMLLVGPNYLSRQVVKQLSESFGGEPRPVK